MAESRPSWKYWFTVFVTMFVVLSLLYVAWWGNSHTYVPPANNLFDFREAITLVVVEVPLGLGIAWLIPTLFEQRREEVRRKMDTQDRQGQEREDRLSAVIARLKSFTAEWPMLQERMRREDFRSTDDPDISRVRKLADGLRESIANLRAGDLGSRDEWELDSMANDMVALGNEIVRLWGDPMMGRSPETRDAVISQGDSIRDGIEALRRRTSNS